MVFKTRCLVATIVTRHSNSGNSDKKSHSISITIYSLLVLFESAHCVIIVHCMISYVQVRPLKLSCFPVRLITHLEFDGNGRNKRFVLGLNGSFAVNVDFYGGLRSKHDS